MSIAAPVALDAIQPAYVPPPVYAANPRANSQSTQKTTNPQRFAHDPLDDFVTGLDVAKERGDRPCVVTARANELDYNCFLFYADAVAFGSSLHRH
ncbi:hypothetical protein ACOSQ4_007279 [Xanthoceras sorbifolium]